MFAWGNPSRGDDAVGPWFADRFRPRASSSLLLVEDFQLQVAHLLDCRLGNLLFVDARCHDTDGYRFERALPVTGLSHTSHALSPGELLGYYPRVFPDESAPPGFQLTVPGRNFDLGQPMSASTLAQCRAAAALVERLLRLPDCRHWQRYISPDPPVHTAVSGSYDSSDSSSSMSNSASTRLPTASPESR
jgi:hypothetical protein